MKRAGGDDVKVSLEIFGTEENDVRAANIRSGSISFDVDGTHVESGSDDGVDTGFGVTLGGVSSCFRSERIVGRVGIALMNDNIPFSKLQTPGEMVVGIDGKNPPGSWNPSDGRSDIGTQGRLTHVRERHGFFSDGFERRGELFEPLCRRFVFETPHYTNTLPNCSGFNRRLPKSFLG